MKLRELSDIQQTHWIHWLCHVVIVRPIHTFICLMNSKKQKDTKKRYRGGATPGRARSNDLAGRSTALAEALPRPAYCFASVIVWTENKNVTISDPFICFILTVKRRWPPVFWGKSACRWPGWRIFWPRNDLAPLLRWRRHSQYGCRNSLVSSRTLCVLSWTRIRT